MFSRLKHSALRAGKTPLKYRVELGIVQLEGMSPISATACVAWGRSGKLNTTNSAAIDSYGAGWNSSVHTRMCIGQILAWVRYPLLGCARCGEVR